MNVRSKVQSLKSKVSSFTFYVLRFTHYALRIVLYPSSLKPQASSLKGFTLLEVLIASSILSIVLTILYGVFSQTLTSKRIAEDRSALSRTARIVLLRIGEDLQG